MKTQPNKIAYIATTGKVKNLLGILFFSFGFAILPALAQTSWKGTTSTAWTTTSNWTAGVPTAAVDAVIGDASFTGAYQPAISAASNCNSLTIGTGTKASTLSVDKQLTISGSLTIGSNGTLNHDNATITIIGSWFNTGNYNSTHVNAAVVFAGSVQSISGATSFRKLTINAGSTTTFNANITVAKTLIVNGTLDTSDPGYLVTLPGGSSFSVNAGGTIKVKAATFAGNYSSNPILDAASTVEYASATTNQTVAALSYGKLKISGVLVKTLAGNITLASTSASVGYLEIASGTLDLTTYTANRGSSVSGGSVTISNGATLKIGATNTFPANYATSNLATTSTVEYYGTNQTVSKQPYGNLILSSGSGTATKTMPATAMVIANDFTSTKGPGTSVSFTAAANISVNGNITIGASTIFNGGAFSHTISGNWTNSGTFTGSTSTVTMSGASKTITGNSAFNNLTVSGLGITSSATTLSASGNLNTSGPGTFAHSGGTLTMSGSSKSITGADITLNNLTLSGTISSTSSMTINGNLVVNGSLNATAGTINMNGASKTISGTGSITFFGLQLSRAISTAISFSVKSDVSAGGTGALTATAGTISFTGTSTFAGTHNLYNVTLNGTQLQLGANSTLGVAGTLTLTAGTFNVTSSVPNTVNFNAAGNQNIPAATFNNLSLSTSGIKSALGALVINNSLLINASTTFNAASYTHSIYKNWTNNGTFTASTSTVQFLGDTDASIAGITTFNIVTVNKAASVNYISLNNNITAQTVNMSSGELRTGSNSVTITNTRTGNGTITGTIIRTHTFNTSVDYAFESSYNTINFSSITGTVSSISVTVQKASIDDFPLEGSINRVYINSITNTGSYSAKLRLHYEDVELNGNVESTMSVWQYVASWLNTGKSSNNSTNNWVENTSLTNLNGRWTLSDVNQFAIWKGTTSTAWETPSNWKAGVVPSSQTIIQIGTETFTNQPSLSSSVSAKAITFGSVKGATLTLAAGATLNVSGNVRGDWAADATHTISVGNQTMNVGGDLSLSNGISTRVIRLIIDTGTLYVTGSLTQTSGASITFRNSGTLRIDNQFDNNGGAFTASTGTVIYGGTVSQAVGDAITYYNLAFMKPSGTATFASTVRVNGNLTLSTGGVFNVEAPVIVLGNVTINSGVTVNEGSQTITVGGNWSRSGVYNSYLGTVRFNGSGSQTIGSTSFYNLTILKTGGSITPTGNLTINGNLTITSGTFDLSTYTANRSVAGGTFTLSAGAALKVGGSSNFPSNFTVKTISATSTVEYNGTMAQTVLPFTYGNLDLNNGGASAKTLTGSTTVSGNFTINSGATLAADSCTLSLLGDFNNAGSLVPQTGTVVLKGTGKSMNGATNFNNLIISGSYSATAGSNLVIAGYITLSGSYVNGSNSITVSGDVTASGTYSSDGVTTYTGTQVQTLRFSGTLLSPMFQSTVVFAGTVAPVLNSTATPTFVNVIVSNTAGIRSSVNWIVLKSFDVAPGSSFDGGSLTHTFFGPLTNNGTVSSTGLLKFSPAPPYNNAASTTLQLGSGANFISTGTVEFGGSRQIIISGTPGSFNNVTVSNINAAGITPVGNWNILGDMTVKSGATFNDGVALSHTLRKNLSVAGTFNGGTSTIAFNPLDSVDYISGSGSITFNNLTIGGSIASHADFNVTGNFTNNSVFDPGSSLITFTGASPSIIGGTTNPTPFDRLIINKQASTVTLATGISGITELTITGGTLADGGLSILQHSVSGGSLSIAASATLEIDLVNTLPVFSSYTFDPISTVNYAGSVQAIAVQPYGNLTLSNSGTKSAAVATTLATTVTNNSTLAIPEGATLQLSADWINNGTFVPQNASTVKFAGTGIQNISGTSVTNFKNIEVTNTANPGVRVQSNQNLVGVLTLSSNVVFDADGSSNTAVFTLISSGDNPTADAAVGPLPVGARVDGKVTVQRFMTKEGTNFKIYRYISSPLQNATVADIQNEIPVMGTFTGASTCGTCGIKPTMFYYDESVISDLNKDGKFNTNDGYYKFPSAASTETLLPGRGYSLFVRGDLLASTAWDVRGNINAGNITPVSIPVSYTSSGNAANDGWNLVGNPFPSSVDWNSAGWTKTNLENTIYTTDNGSGGVFATWNGLIGTNGGSQYIATAQAFWVRTDGLGTPVLTANENVKSSGTQTKFFRQKALENVLRITLKKGMATDETVIHFREDVTDGFDKNADARKLMNKTFNLSSKINAGTLLAINSLPLVDCNTTVKLSVDNAKKGSYQLNFKEVISFSNGAAITLTDKFTNKTTTVTEGLNYNFSVTTNPASSGSGRFQLQFLNGQPLQDFSASSQDVCESVNAEIEITNSESIANYYVVMNDSAISTSVAGNGEAISVFIDKKYLKAGLNTITIQAVNQNCSSSFLKKDITVNVIKTAEITVQSATSCEPSSLTLKALSADAVKYNWFESETAATAFGNQHDSVFTTPLLTASKTYYVSAIGSTGCESPRVAVSAEIGNLPNVLISESNGILESNYDSNNQWYLNGSLLPGDTLQTIEAAMSGIYKVEVTENGCSSSTEFTFVVTQVTSDFQKAVSAYPNPVSSILTVETSQPDQGIANAVIINSLGQMIGRVEFNHQNNQSLGEFDMTNQLPGLYFVHVTGGEKTYDIKIIKQ